MLLLKKKEPLERGATPFQNAADLIELRNALVHYTPEWSYEDGKHKKLGARLSNRFDTSPFCVDGDSFFPKKCMSYGCAKWAVSSALNFIDAFTERADLRNPFDSQRARILAGRLYDEKE
jgi:hypothetical protein